MLTALYIYNPCWVKEDKVQRFHPKLLGESIAIESISRWLGTINWTALPYKNRIIFYSHKDFRLHYTLVFFVSLSILRARIREMRRKWQLTNLIRWVVWDNTWDWNVSNRLALHLETSEMRAENFVTIKNCIFACAERGYRSLEIPN